VQATGYHLQEKWFCNEIYIFVIVTFVHMGLRNTKRELWGSVVPKSPRYHCVYRSRFDKRWFEWMLVSRDESLHNNTCWMIIIELVRHFWMYRLHQIFYWYICKASSYYFLLLFLVEAPLKRPKMPRSVHDRSDMQSSHLLFIRSPRCHALLFFLCTSLGLPDLKIQSVINRV